MTEPVSDPSAATVDASHVAPRMTDDHAFNLVVPEIDILKDEVSHYTQLCLVFREFLIRCRVVGPLVDRTNWN